MKKHILLVEKDRNGFLDFMNVLEVSNVNCKVTYTTSYDHALQMLDYIVPDCIFMRIDVSEEDTLECVKKIRHHHALENSTIVLYDDEVTSKMIRRSIKQGADYCIDRPCSYADITYLLKDMFSRSRSPRDRSSEC
jgi:PleD family two-component response regulator